MFMIVLLVGKERSEELWLSYFRTQKSRVVHQEVGEDEADPNSPCSHQHTDSMPREKCLASE